MRLIHTSYLILVMEATTIKIPTVLHTITVEVGIPNTLLPVKLPRSRHCEWYGGHLLIYEFQTDFSTRAMLLSRIQGMIELVVVRRIN